jgi:hypothetical protein
VMLLFFELLIIKALANQRGIVTRLLCFVNLFKEALLGSIKIMSG